MEPNMNATSNLLSKELKNVNNIWPKWVLREKDMSFTWTKEEFRVVLLLFIVKGFWLETVIKQWAECKNKRVFSSLNIPILTIKIQGRQIPYCKTPIHTFLMCKRFTGLGSRRTSEVESVSGRDSHSIWEYLQMHIVMPTSSCTKIV